jgi:hypothetical protein
MTLKFNPLSGVLDFAASPQRKFRKDQIIVDSTFLSSPSKALEAIVVEDSEIILLNGLYTCDTEYTVVGNVFTWIDSSDLRVGDTIDIRYNSEL